MKEELVVLVDRKNRKIGVTEKIKAHEEGALHRAFSIFIFNSRKELLIQQRAATKYHSDGLWSNTVCSHPGPGETYLHAVHRRLKEEMGFDCKVRKLFSFVYNAGLRNGLIEHEYDCVFIGIYDGKPEPDPKEVMNYRWVSLTELKQDMKKNPEKYSVWLKRALKGIKRSDVVQMLSQNVSDRCGLRGVYLPEKHLTSISNEFSLYSRSDGNDCETEEKRLTES